MLRFHEHRGHRFCEDTDEGTFWCSTVEGEPWDGREKVLAAIDRHVDMPIINYQVYLGETESHQYTVQARNTFDLIRLITEKFEWGATTWETVFVGQGYPKGAMKFLVKRPGGLLGGLSITRVLILPPRT